MKCTEKHLTGISLTGSSIYIDIRTRTIRARCRETSAPYVSSLAKQCNRRDNRRAVPANDGTIIRPVGVLWIFKRPSRPWHGSAFLCLFARFRDQLVDALLRRTIQTHLIFTCDAIQRKANFFSNPGKRTITFRFLLLCQIQFRNALLCHNFKKFEIKVVKQLFQYMIHDLIYDTCNTTYIWWCWKGL